jgi:spore coat polysaccharide biosynthesis protein SpsF (cytidylyltransferase family)
MKSGAIILARLDSNRLPGKALLKIGNRVLIEHCIIKLKDHSSLEPILATSNREIDLPLIELATKNNIRYFTGELSNVAARILKCLEKFELNCFARINGDSPFLDTSLLNSSLDEFRKGEYDFVTNLLPRTFPYGISVEIFDSKIFRDGYNKFKGNKVYEEHVTSYFYDNRYNYRYKNIESASLFPAEDLLNTRLVVDTQDDYETIVKMHDVNEHIFEESIENIYHTYNQVTKKQNKAIL